METKFKVGDKVSPLWCRELVWKITEVGTEMGGRYVMVLERGNKDFMSGEISCAYFSEEGEWELVEERKEYKEGEECVSGEEKKGGFELYRDYVRERVEFGYFEKGYKCEATSGLKFLARKAEDKYVCRELRRAYEFVVMSVSYDGEWLDCMLSMDEAEQLALVLQQKVREVREDRTMEVNKGR